MSNNVGKSVQELDNENIAKALIGKKENLCFGSNRFKADYR
jgi:hypothetical protein